MSGKTISVRNAQVKTATVEIKSLTVSGRQVTMGVFRQLLMEDVVDANTGQLVGIPWGLVNYFPKPCQDADHLHVVWQKGEELRRACLYKELYNPLRQSYRSGGKKFSAALDNMGDRVGELTSAWIHAASLNEGWSPSSYRLGSGTYDVRDYPTKISDPRYDSLPALHTTLESHDGRSVLVDAYVSAPLAQLWHQRLELYAVPAPREDALNTPKFHRDEEGNLGVRYQDATTERQHAYRVGGQSYTNTQYDDVTQPLSDEDRSNLRRAEAEIREGVTSELEWLLESNGEDTDARSTETARTLAVEALDEVLKVEDDYTRHYEEIADLDQLFIAV